MFGSFKESHRGAYTGLRKGKRASGHPVAISGPLLEKMGVWPEVLGFSTLTSVNPKLLEGKSGQSTKTPSCFLRSASNVELTVCV